ncbi:MAG: hypothetical protein ACPGJS_00740 [Flammeovirgaceae bacterium]
MSKITLNQKAMLAQYEKIYQHYNQLCKESDLPNKLAMQNRGALYTTGYRCLVNFCTAYHRNQAEGYMFETSAALLAQDWGKKQQSKTVRRHLIRLAQQTKLDTDPTDFLKIGIPLFTKLEEFKKGFYKNVRLWVNPCFIVYSDARLQEEHQRFHPLPTWKPPPKEEKAAAGAEQSRKTALADGEASAKVRDQIRQRLAGKFRVV